MTSLGSLSTEDFLSVVGQRVRRRRTALRMSRKRLAEISGVSERYLAQLEAGQGNMSIALLRKVTIAMSLPLGELMAEERSQMREPEPAI
jgi:XRE family aerobic/anaerobic benzoate catabolism transcriptional regulator